MFILSALCFQGDKRYVYGICIMLRDKRYVYIICIMLSGGETACLWYLHYAEEGKTIGCIILHRGRIPYRKKHDSKLVSAFLLTEGETVCLPKADTTVTAMLEQPSFLTYMTLYDFTLHFQP